MFVVDTNVFIYAIDRKSKEHTQCRTLLETWRKDRLPWYTTWGILYEFLRVSTHPRVFRNPLTLEQAWSLVKAILASPGLRMLSEGENHTEVAARTFKEIQGLSGNLLHYAHIAILMREHGIKRIYTRDTDFHRFPFLEVIDPVNI
ncbi:MAG TPA: type II toxin-antitoxin system VapC family toxin [Thermodesulfobacteriota bacterium]|nr:type II toxin-antitoxin system VapC family toxin [Thermodesulfobacteriota bacterium]